MKAPIRMLASVGRDVGGNVLPMTALGVLISAGLVGGAVDMSRAYRAQNKLQAACDAGVLAGRRSVSTNGFDETAEQQAENYFDTNFNEEDQRTRNTRFASTSEDSGNTVTGVASADLDTAIVRILGFNEFNLSVECQASMGVGNSDVTMVLDTTGSMDWDLPGTSEKRIVALRAAMKNFYDTVDAATSASNARIRYSFVPFSSSVNVGHLLYDLDPSYIVDTALIQSREPNYTEVENQVFSGWDSAVVTTGSGTSSTNYSNYQLYSTTKYNSSSSCNDGLPSNTGWANNGVATTSDPVTDINDDGQQVVTVTVTQPQRKTEYTCSKESGKWYRFYRYGDRSLFSHTYQTSDPLYDTVVSTSFDNWTYKQMSYDVSDYKAFETVQANIGSNGAAVSSTWAGCIEERESTPAASFSYSGLLGISPNAWDLDIDSAPSGDDTSKWSPMWPEVAYYRTENYYSGGRLRTRMSSSATTTQGSKASSYCPQRSRLLAEMTETDFDAYADSLFPQGATYLDYGILWGARISSPTGMWSDNVSEEPDNGATVSRHMIYMTDGEMDTSTSIQTLHGIEFQDRRVTSDGSKTQSDARHTSRFLALCDAVKAKGIRLWVIAFGANLTTDLETCASSGSAFEASSASQLNSAFQEIAKQVGELRIIQ